MKRALLLASVLALGAAGQEGQPRRWDFPEAWKDWRYARPLSIDPAQEPRLARVTLPTEVFGRAQAGLGDLRVIDDEDREVPYVLHTRRGGRTQVWRDVKVLDTGFVPGSYSQALIDTGPSGEIHNTLEVQTPDPDFFARVEVAASDDEKTWRIVRSGAPLYRFRSEGREGTQLLRYPDTRSRWLRLRLAETQREIPIRGCRVTREVVKETELVLLPGSTRPMEEPPEGQSGWQADLGTAQVPVTVIEFETPQPAFHRAVQVQHSRDGENWRQVTRGEIYRYPAKNGGQPSMSLRVEFTEAKARYWRVLVVNSNDPPLEGLRFELFGIPRHVVLQQTPGRSYRLLYGYRRAAAPQYDLARLTSPEEWETAHEGLAGEEEENALLYRPPPPKPWSERHPVVLWIALGIAVAVLGWLAIRSLGNPA